MRMKRLAVLPLLLAAGVQFAASSHLFDSHEEWTQTCTTHSLHFCSDVNPHDSDLCAICMVCAAGPGPVQGEFPILVLVEAVLPPVPESDLIFTEECNGSCPRGPPGLLA